MLLTISIKEKFKFAFFIKLLKEFNYVEIIEINDEDTQIPNSHKEILENRLKKIEKGETDFKNWDTIKSKYETKKI
jgi:hypothetical protein